MRFWIATLLTLSLGAHAGPIIVGTGGGSSELLLFLAQSESPRWLSLCRRLDRCARGLETTLDLHLDRRPWESEVLVVDEDDPKGRDFDTEARPGAAIRIHQKRLRDAEGEALGFHEVFALLIRAWGVQLGIPEAVTRELGLRMRELLSDDYMRSPWIEAARLNLSIIQFKSLPGLLVIEDRSASDLARSFSLDLADKFDCAVAGSAGASRILAMSQVRWNQKIRLLGVEHVSLLADLAFGCGDGKNYDAKIVLYLPVRQIDGAAHVPPAEMTVRLQRIEPRP